MPKLALQEVADPASDQIRTGSARPPARDAEPESHHRHEVHGNGGKDTHNQANNEHTAQCRSCIPLHMNGDCFTAMDTGDKRHRSIPL